MLAANTRRALVAQARLQRSTLRSAAPLTRAFWNVSLPAVGGPGGAQFTKYKIVKPGKEGVAYDDFLLALPERDHLASFTKDVPLFIRYLKVVTDVEGRGANFVAFLERAKNGLVVESDVFIGTEELLALMWKNGYSDAERNAVQSAFPADYKFHYPELSALFNLPEEDTYKFCMRTRMEASHIGALDAAQVARKGWMRDHWLMFGVGIMIFKTFPFYNYYFGLKVFGTSMWVWTMWGVLHRMISKTCRRNEYMAAQKTAKEVMEGEDSIMTSMQRFANDAKCKEYLANFKTETESKIGTYRKGLALNMKADLSERALKQLQNVASFEAGMGAALQDLVIREAASSFREKFPTDKAMQAKAFSAALTSLSGGTVAPGADPVSMHFEEAFKTLQGANLASLKGNATGSLAERVAHAQQLKETEFQQTFMVTPQEAAEVRTLAGQAKSGDGFDFSKLPAASAERLDALYASINAKVGYSLPETLGTKAIPDVADTGADSYVAQVNSQLADAGRHLRNARLAAFAQAFA